MGRRKKPTTNPRAMQCDVGRYPQRREGAYSRRPTEDLGRVEHRIGEVRGPTGTRPESPARVARREPYRRAVMWLCGDAATFISRLPRDVTDRSDGDSR